MSSLLLVRHGQASFGAPDYDRLSPLGIEQMRALGRHLGRAGRRLDAVYSGPCRRQIDSAHHLVAAAREAGADYPDPERIADLDELPAFPLYGRFAPDVVAREPDLAVDEVFAIVLRGWAHGELHTDSIETFAEFAARVERGLGEIARREGRGRRIAVVTSGGPIGIALQLALDLDPVTAMRTALVVANSSVSELRYRDSVLGLYGFNHLGHLDDSQVTLR